MRVNDGFRSGNHVLSSGNQSALKALRVTVIRAAPKEFEKVHRLSPCKLAAIADFDCQLPSGSFTVRPSTSEPVRESYGVYVEHAKS